MGRLVAENWEPLHDGGSLAPDVQGLQHDGASNLDVEVPADDWKPLNPDQMTSPAGSVVFVDGVQRVETWMTAVDDDDPERSFIAAAASFAAGALRTDHSGVRIDAFEVDRALFATGGLEPLRCDGATFRPIVVADASPAELRSQVTAHMRQLERKLSLSLAAADLTVLDGPLTGSSSTPGVVGFIKSHHRVYLPPPQQRMLGALSPGQRSPLFVTQSNFSRFAWYLRLPGGNDYPLSGVVRLECAGEMSVKAAVELADVTALSLPRFASQAHRDARAPNNLTPIGSLESQLRHRLSDATVVSRRIRAALRDYVL